MENTLEKTLKILFPKYKKINPKKNNFGYVILININDLHTNLKVIVEDNLDRDIDDEEESNGEITLHVRYDGHDHFCDNGQVIKDKQEDSVESKWTEIGCCEYMLRMPYFTQLNKELSNHWFGIDVDLSNSVPHGFATNAILPSRFCRNGEEVFKNHLKNLPYKVGKDVYESLKLKVKCNDFDSVCPKSLWAFLIENFDKEVFKLINICLKQCPVHNGITIIDKYTKYIDEKDLTKLLSCPLAILYFQNLDEEISLYFDYKKKLSTALSPGV